MGSEGMHSLWGHQFDAHPAVALIKYVALCELTLVAALDAFVRSGRSAGADSGLENRVPFGVGFNS
jgi:hypothetical protein